jgi:hypothetical protein
LILALALFSFFGHAPRQPLQVCTTHITPQMHAAVNRALITWASILDLEYVVDADRGCDLLISADKTANYVPGAVGLTMRYGHSALILLDDKRWTDTALYLVAVHEFGHALGLDDLYKAKYRSDVMYWQEQTAPRVISPYDLKHIRGYRSVQSKEVQLN